MPVRIVQSKTNARLKELRSALSNPGRGDSGLEGIEGPNLIEEALRSGLTLSCVFVAQESQRLLENLPLPPETEILLLPRELLQPALTTETPQLIAALIQPPAWTWAHLLDSDRNHSPLTKHSPLIKHSPQAKPSPLILVLTGLQDPGNLGTILRSAEAFGATGIVSLPGTVNEWNPKAVRASAGSLFRVPVVSETARDCFANIRQAGIKIWTTALNDAHPADEIDLTRPSAILIGNEGNGVPAELAAQCDGSITIPHPGPVESLNAAIAASVLLYEASRQRSQHAAPPSPVHRKRI